MDTKEIFNSKAIELAKRIASLKEIKQQDWGKEMSLTDFYNAYLGNIPKLVQSLVNEAYEFTQSSSNIPKAAVLNNFIFICKEEGVKPENPFIVFIMDDTNFRNLLENNF